MVENTRKPTATECVQYMKFQVGLSKDKADGDLSHRGIDNVIKFLRFINSPEGKSLQTEILKHLIQEHQQKEAAQEAQREHLSFLTKLMTFMVLMFLGRKARAEEKLKEWIAHYNNSILKPQTPTPANEPSVSNEMHLSHDALELESLSRLKQQLENIESKYNKYNESLSNIEESSLHTPNLTPEQISERSQKLATDIQNMEDNMELMKLVKSPESSQNIADMEYQLEGLKAEKNVLDMQQRHGMMFYKNGVPSTYWDGDVALTLEKQNELNIVQDKTGALMLVPKGRNIDELSDTDKLQFKKAFDIEKNNFTHLKVKHIDQQINLFNKAIDADMQLIDHHMTNGHDDKAFEIAELNKARFMQVAALNDYKLVMQGKKIMVDEQGQLVTNLKADKNDINSNRYIIDKEESIHNEAGTMYLLKPGQNFQTMTANEKEIAQRLAIDKGSIKTLLKNNKTFEMGNRDELLTQVNQKIETLKQKTMSTTPKPEPTQTKKDDLAEQKARHEKSKADVKEEALKSPTPFGTKPSPFKNS